VGVPWSDGALPPSGLPFGDPLAQSAGQGFLPVLPAWPLLRLSPLPNLPAWRLTPPQAGFWLILAGAAACLITLALRGGTG
jgi:hypothetical protein